MYLEGIAIRFMYLLQDSDLILEIYVATWVISGWLC